jgi:hypothetical protein
MKNKFGNIVKPFMPQANAPIAQVGFAKWYNGNAKNPDLIR